MQHFNDDENGNRVEDKLSNNPIVNIIDGNND